MPEEELPHGVYRVHGRLTSTAWRKIGLFGVAIGTFSTDGKVLTFRSADRGSFELPISDLTRVSFPWYGFRLVGRLRAGEKLYRMTFAPPNEQEGSLEEALAGLATTRFWREWLMGLKPAS